MQVTAAIAAESGDIGGGQRRMHGDAGAAVDVGIGNDGLNRGVVAGKAGQFDIGRQRLADEGAHVGITKLDGAGARVGSGGGEQGNMKIIAKMHEFGL